jgi:shikimate kinase
MDFGTSCTGESSCAGNTVADLRVRKGRVYITGFMGSGKSTIGPILANTLGYEFMDVDREIEKSEGMAVGEIFRTRGEEAFRQLERSTLERASAVPRIVVSLGGGTLTDPVNYARIHETGVLVYLKLSADEIFRRVQRRTDRPLLATENGERLPPDELRQRVERLLAEREPLYRSAHITIVPDTARIGHTVDRIARLLSPLVL